MAEVPKYLHYRLDVRPDGVTVDVTPVDDENFVLRRTGKWKWTADKDWAGGGKTVCSCCGYGFADAAYHEVDEFRFCPVCGAEMEGGESDGV